MSRGGDTRVFLGNLPPDCKVSDIQEFLDKYGRVRNVLIKQGKYGFAEFDDPRDADDAVYELHGKRLLGSRITLEFAKGPKRGDRRAPWVSKYGAPTRTKHALKVLNLSTRVSWQDLKDLLRKAGEVCFAEAHTERSNEGRVELATSEDLERVVKRYQGYDLNGRKLELVREQSRSRSRSRSRRRSRSRSRRSKSRRDSRSRSRKKSKSKSRSRSGKSKSRQESRSRSRSRSRSKSANSTLDPEDQDVKRQRKRSHSRTSNNQPSPDRKTQKSDQEGEIRKEDD